MKHVNGGYRFGRNSVSPARLLRLKVMSDAAWSVGYERGFGPNDECIVPAKYLKVKSFFVAGWNVGQSDYKKERE